nr:MAG TPA: hypothetical protein [Caudoviricetes sp.]
MFKQFKNKEGRVFKETYSPDKFAERLWDSLNYYRQLCVDIDLFDTSLEFDLRYTTKEEIRMCKYREKLIKDQINDIREKSGLSRIPRSSIKWYYKSEVIEGIKEYKYNYVG